MRDSLYDVLSYETLKGTVSINLESLLLAYSEVTKYPKGAALVDNRTTTSGLIGYHKANLEKCTQVDLQPFTWISMTSHLNRLTKR